MSPKRFKRLDSGGQDVLEREILDALGGAQTRSAVELVTDLAVDYGDLEPALERLLDSHLVMIEYEGGGETYYSLSRLGLNALHDGGTLELAPAEAATEFVAPRETATRQ